MMENQGRPLMIAITVLLLLVVIAVLPASTYKIRADVLVFENLARQTDYTGDPASATRLQFITNQSEAVGLDVYSSDRDLIQTVDFSQYFVLAVFFGYGGSQQSEVSKIAQFKDVVWLKSEFPTPPTEGQKFSPYQIVKIERSQIQRYSQVTFKLVNEVFVDKAKVNPPTQFFAAAP
jgi:hypothetical protein